MKRKILCLFLYSVMLACVISGCGTDKYTANTSPSSSTVSETEYKTMEPPAEVWTEQHFFDIAYICGKKVSLPVTLDSLGIDFEFDKKAFKLMKKTIC